MEPIVIVGHCATGIDRATLVAALMKIATDVRIVETRNDALGDGERDTIHALARRLQADEFVEALTHCAIAPDRDDWLPNVDSATDGGVNFDASPHASAPLTKQHYQARADPDTGAYRNYFESHRHMVASEAAYRQEVHAANRGQIRVVGTPNTEPADRDQRRERLRHSSRVAFQALIEAKRAYREAAAALGVLDPFGRTPINRTQCPA